MTVELLDQTTARISVTWSHPRTWRSHPLVSEPYWVETEVEVVRDDVVVDQLSWSAPLSDEELAAYDDALSIKWQLLLG